MAVIRVIPLSTEGRSNDKGATVREEYRCVDNSARVNAAEFFANWLAAGGCDIGAWYPGAENCVCRQITTKREGKDKEKDGAVWHVTVEFGPAEEVKDRENDCKIRVSTETNDETDGRYDLEQKLNVNSAGDFFEEKLPVRNNLLIFSYDLTYGNNPIPSFRTMVWTVNTAAWHGLPAGTCLLRSLSCERSKDNEQGKYIWPTQIEIAYNPNGWKLKKADCGFYTNNGRILDDEGAPIETAQLLNGSGELNTSGNPVLLEFVIYGTSDFGIMNLPDPFADNTP